MKLLNSVVPATIRADRHWLLLDYSIINHWVTFIQLFLRQAAPLPVLSSQWPKLEDIPVKGQGPHTHKLFIKHYLIES